MRRGGARRGGTSTEQGHWRSLLTGRFGSLAEGGQVCAGSLLLPPGGHQVVTMSWAGLTTCETLRVACQHAELCAEAVFKLINGETHHEEIAGASIKPAKRA